jgi:hypothetical protein
MQLERIGVALRPRTAMEAMDLGAAMLRAHARPVWTAWFAFTLPIFLLCQLVAWFCGMPWLGLLLPWWLRPLFDRIPLYVLSRAVFERAPAWRETLKGQMRWPWARTVAMLTWLRVDTHRSLRLPMELLEGLPRSQRSARWRVLSRPLGGKAGGLTWMCIAFELVLFMSICLFALWLLPGEVLPESMRDLNQAFTLPAFKHALVWITSGVAYLSMSVVEPLYVATGFALYLNRRTQLEAWDIDLTFRRLRERLLEAGVASVLLVACMGWLPSGACAADTHPASAEPTTRVSIVQAFHQPVNDRDALFASEAAYAYRDPAFGSEHKVSRWVPKPWFRPTPHSSGDMSFFSAFFGNVASGVVNVLAWGLLAVVLVALVVFALRNLRVSVPKVERVVRKPTVLNTSTLHEEVMPADLAGAAGELWRNGRRREALALLYRGSMLHAAAALRMPVPVDATESDWLQYARSIEDLARRERLIAIVRTWQLAAYANRYPADAEVAMLLSGWPAQQVAP